MCAVLHASFASGVRDDFIAGSFFVFMIMTLVVVTVLRSVGSARAMPMVSMSNLQNANEKLE